MQIIDNLIIISLIVTAFILGLKVDSRYNDRSRYDVKDALERQFVRLQARSDADDPCKPYISHIVPLQPTGDYDGDEKLRPITPQFMETLAKTGQAKTQFRKSDLAK